MVAAQTHRGPDDQGIRAIDIGDFRLGLGQRRLSILDLSELGHQPMEHPETGDLLIYNGELYNFRELRKQLESMGSHFQSQSDTEVMLHALARWGVSALSRFHGMFAIAWYRHAPQTLVLARDPVGIKPLYFAESGGTFLFASEVRAILASGLVPAQIDRRGLASMLAYGSVVGPETIIEGIQSFPAGSWREFPLRAKPGEGAWRTPVHAYWEPPVPDTSITSDLAVERVRAVLEESVRDHLESDVPVGVFLSSGIDSTIVAGLAAKHSPNIMAYTVGSADNPDMSESEIAAHSAHRLGIPHTDVQITGADALASARRWLNALDQPSVDGLNTYVVSGAVRNAGVTVALSGLGGDEMFCGYGNFEEIPKAFRAHRWLRLAPRAVRRQLAKIASRGKSESVRAKMLDMFQSNGRIVDLYLLRRRILSESQMHDLGLDADELSMNSHFLTQPSMDRLSVDERFPFAAVSTLETLCYAKNTLLRDSDVNGMAHSLEIRVPMFDTRVLNLAMSLTGAARMPKGRADKYLLRTAFADVLGERVLGEKTKRGFILPIKRWMATSMRDECEASLESLKKMSLLRREGIDSVWKSFRSQPESPAWSRAFALFVLGHYFSRISAFSAPRDRSQSHWRRTPSSNETEGAKPSSAVLRVRSA